MIDNFERFVNMLATRTSQLAQVALVFAMAIIVANVVLRIPWRPVPGTVELVEISGAILLSLGIAYTAMMKGHIAVGILVEKLPERIQAIIDFIINTIALLFSCILAWEVFSYAASSMQRGYTTGHLNLPLAPYIYLVGFGLSMLALVLLKDMLKALVLAVKGCENK